MFLVNMLELFLQKIKKSVSIVDAFQKILDHSDRKPKKIWVDKGSEFYNNSFKRWLKDNDIEMYSIHNEEKPVVNLLISIPLYKAGQYFPKTYEPIGGDISVIADLSNYPTKAGIKNISHVDTLSFALKTNLASSKTEVDKLGIDKLVPVPIDLSKVNDVVKNDVV